MQIGQPIQMDGGIKLGCWMHNHRAQLAGKRTVGDQIEAAEQLSIRPASVFQRTSASGPIAPWRPNLFRSQLTGPSHYWLHLRSASDGHPRRAWSFTHTTPCQFMSIAWPKLTGKGLGRKDKI